VDIKRGQLATLDEAQLRDVPFADDPVKGAGLNLAVARWSLGVGGTYQSIFDAPSRESLFPATGMLGLEAQLHNFFRRDWIWAFDLALGSAAGQVDLSTGGQVPFHFSEVGLGTSMLVEWPHAWLTPFVGARLALLLMNRTFDDPTLTAQHFSTLSPGIVAGLKLRLFGNVGLVARGRVHYLLYNVDENRSLGYWELASAVNYDL
jgi:hypothetical protein